MNHSDQNPPAGGAPKKAQQKTSAPDAALSARSFGNLGCQDRESWAKAWETLAEFNPVRWFVWRIIHSVFGRPCRIGKPDPFAFDVLRAFILTAAQDPTLRRGDTPTAPEKSLSDALGLIGGDVAAAACFLHAICVRVCNALPDRISRPVIDDALLRAVIGYHVGGQLGTFGSGRGMLVGFAGRFGLAVQMSAAPTGTAHQTMELLARGMQPGEVGKQLYGCDPLQVSALALALAGCHRGAALGVGGFIFDDLRAQQDPEALSWLAAFSIVEALRMGKPDKIEEATWLALQFNDEVSRSSLKRTAHNLVRHGHRWGWMTASQEPQIAQALTSEEP